MDGHATDVRPVLKASLLGPRQANGYKSCRGRGFKGRQAVAEFLEITSDIQDLILKGEGEDSIERAAVRNSMVPIYENGIDAAHQEFTTLAELRRVVRLIASG